MATYIIGDLHGCYRGLQRLLELIDFSDEDTLYLCGDLVNRGPESLEVLRYVKNLGNCQVVLGNHDFHCLALGYGHVGRHHHQLGDILQAEDREALLQWLRQQKLAIALPEFEALIVHAGVHPQWSLENTLGYAAEIEQALRDEGDHAGFYEALYGDSPNQWQDNLPKTERRRLIINIFTRMRFLSSTMALDFTKTCHPLQETTLTPWYDFPLQVGMNVYFGHWAALRADRTSDHSTALDGGYVYGGRMHAYRLEDKARFSIKCDHV